MEELLATRLMRKGGFFFINPSVFVGRCTHDTSRRFPIPPISRSLPNARSRAALHPQPCANLFFSLQKRYAKIRTTTQRRENGLQRFNQHLQSAHVRIPTFRYLFFYFYFYYYREPFLTAFIFPNQPTSTARYQSRKQSRETQTGRFCLPEFQPLFSFSYYRFRKGVGDAYHNHNPHHAPALLLLFFQRGVFHRRSRKRNSERWQRQRTRVFRDQQHRICIGWPATKTE